MATLGVRSWQPLSLFIVYCLPALWTVNNGAPSLGRSAAEAGAEADPER